MVGRQPSLLTVRDRIAWAYANLACAHSALKAGRQKHVTIDWIVRARLFRGLREGTMQFGSLYDDERYHLLENPTCVYCGCNGPLSVDHLIPRIAGGTHAQHNLVRACRRCNSSKNDKDLLEWYEKRGGFPGLMLLRRYLKIVAAYAEKEALMDLAWDDIMLQDMPFFIGKLPIRFPDLAELHF